MPKQQTPKLKADKQDDGFEIALYEEESFVPSLSEPVIERILRSPDIFELQRFEVSGARGTFPSGINNAGQIVGQFQDPSGRTRGFVRGPAIRLIDAPGATLTAARGIDGRGPWLSQNRSSEDGGPAPRQGFGGDDQFLEPPAGPAKHPRAVSEGSVALGD